MPLSRRLSQLAARALRLSQAATRLQRPMSVAGEAPVSSPPDTTRALDKEFDLERRGLLVKVDEVSRFIEDCMSKAGASPSHRKQLADALVEADSRARYCHGLNRLAMYVNEMRALVCMGEGEPTLVADRPAAAWVDGRNLLGPVVGNYAMDLAVCKAQDNGIGIVSCFNSNHYGIAGWYTNRAAEHGLIGISMTNTSPLCFPTRSAKHALGTNALALCAPAGDGDSFDLDMSTTSVAIGRVELAQLKGERSMPVTWAADRHGVPTTRPDDVLEGGGLLPLGGPESTGGYKGYGLSLMVEVLCGVLAGAQWGPHVRRWRDYRQSANLGQTFAAIDPAAFSPGFADRLKVVLDTMRQLKPIDPARPVLVPGDPERQHKALCDKLTGIPYHPNQIEHADHIAAQLGVTPLVAKVPIKVKLDDQ